MSGKTARRARKNAVRLLSMDDVFTTTLTNLMVEYGIDYDRCKTREVNDTLRECCAQYDACKEELLEWAGEREQGSTTTSG